ncbi:MAG: hypothetical protein F6K36_16820 [Symploca sp. SIO3C6]|nr:hypothetical protein [Symploca sp. SIO3C6]
MSTLVNRLLVASSLILGVTTFSSAALAQTTDTVDIQGEVATTLAVTAAPEAAATALDLGGEGTATDDVIVKVAVLTVTSNNEDGVELTITSGDMTNSTDVDATDVVPYQVVTVTGGGAPPVTGDFITASGTDRVEDLNRDNVDGEEDRDLYIMYDAPVVLDPGTYDDTITVSVVDK